MKIEHTRPAPASPFFADLSQKTRDFLSRQGIDLATAAAQLATADAERRPLTPFVSPQAQTPPPTSNRRQRRIEARLDRAAPPPPRPPTRKQRRNDARQAAVDARERRDRRYLARLESRLKAAYSATATLVRPVQIPVDAFRQARIIMADPSGKAAPYFLSHHRHQIGCALIRRAALVPGDNGTTRYAWTDNRAKAICALGLIMLHTAQRTQRTDPWSYLVKTVPRGAFAAAIADPWTGRRPSFSSLSGTHRRGGDWTRGSCGYLRALAAVGLLYTLQPYTIAERAEKIGPSGYATNRYYIISADPLKRPTEELRQAACQVLFGELKIRATSTRNYDVAHGGNTPAADANEPGNPTGPPPPDS
jgi:hypothetical protein